jgi:hypothetical protein
MAINPNTAFSDGTPFTASQANRFPRGVMGLQTLTTQFSTSATHTNFQDNGATLTITTQSGRLYKISYNGHPYPNGGLQGVKYRFVLGASTYLDEWAIPDSALNTGVSYYHLAETVYEATSSSSQTFKVQFAAWSANTVVSDFGDANTKRQFWIEDIGEA